MVHFIPATLCIVYLVHFIFLAWFILCTYLIHFIPLTLSLHSCYLIHISFTLFLMVHFIPATLCILYLVLSPFYFSCLVYFMYLLDPPYSYYFITSFLLLNPCKSYIIFSIRFLYSVKFVLIT